VQRLYTFYFWFLVSLQLCYLQFQEFIIFGSTPEKLVGRALADPANVFHLRLSFTARLWVRAAKADYGEKQKPGITG
jgi:hypothetical protein